MTLVTQTTSTIAVSGSSSSGLGGPLKLTGLPTTMPSSTVPTSLGVAGGSGLKPLGVGLGVTKGLDLQGGKTQSTLPVVTSASATGFKGLGGVDPSSSAGSNGGLGG